MKKFKHLWVLLDYKHQKKQEDILMKTQMNLFKEDEEFLMVSEA